MTQLIPEQWLSMESSGFDKLFAITTRSCDAFERLTALNLQAIRFGLAETQEALARTCVANNLPEMLCLPTLLTPVEFAQTQSYCRQFFEIMCDLQRDSASQRPGCAARQPHFSEDLLGSLATQSRVPCDVPAKPAMPLAPAAGHAATVTTEGKKGRPDKKTIQPMRTE
ncbi:phasin (plasmid) [Paraburkholderia phytofirmans OLGA172]|uniref:Phasin n=1 Tax=Paraburkholderia phytofirmans OLGA172 TaxID=1417228 RepID=A0A167WNL0_9BURK|nr:TIGR01841 family phasin [Paraburkholderia phytofirmans]ANB77857.1 phasin [Paraburkholderia phytofirmans OLGA172]